MVSCSFQKAILQFAHLWIDNPRIGLVWIGHLLIGKVSGLIVFCFQPLSSRRFYEHYELLVPILSLPCLFNDVFSFSRSIPFLSGGFSDFHFCQMVSLGKYSTSDRFWNVLKVSDDIKSGMKMGRYLLIPLVLLGILTMVLPINVTCLEFTTASIYVRTVYISLYNQWQNWWTDYPEIST